MSVFTKVSILLFAAIIALGGVMPTSVGIATIAIFTSIAFVSEQYVIVIESGGK